MLSIPSRFKGIALPTKHTLSLLKPCAEHSVYSHDSKETDSMATYVVEQHELIINKNYGKALSTNRSKEPKITGTTACGRGLPQASRLSSLIL